MGVTASQRLPGGGAMRHGTSTAYVTHKCRCDICRTTHARRQKKYRLDKARGIAKLVDAQPLRDHVDALTAAGMSQWDITIAAGWKSRNALADAYRRAKVTPKTMARVLAVSAPPATRRNGYVDATGSCRRLQALAVMGWPSRAIAERLGNLDPQTYQFIAAGRNRTCRRRTAEAIAELYDELWDQRGPSQRTSTWAQSRGWVPPMAWDDDTIDNPQARPHRGVWQAQHQRGRDAVVEDFLDTYDHHNGRVDIAAHRLGMSLAALSQALHRANREGAGIAFTEVKERKPA